MSHIQPANRRPRALLFTEVLKVYQAPALLSRCALIFTRSLVSLSKQSSCARCVVDDDGSLS